MSGTALTFRSIVQLHGKTATGIPVPEDVIARLGSKRPPVRVTVGGYTYRTTIAPMGGQFLISVSADVRAHAGIAAGDEVAVTVEPDTAPREVTVPADLAEALAHDATAATFFAGLSYSQKSWYVLQVESAKRAETRVARVVKMVEMLCAGRKPGDK